MRDPGRRGKKRDLRRGMNGDGFSLHRYYDNRFDRHFRWVDFNRPDWHKARNAEIEYVRRWAGCDYWNVWGVDHAPADYRRAQNRQHRARCKAALDKALRDGWDDYLPPVEYHDVDFNYY